MHAEESQMEGDYHGQRRIMWFQWNGVKPPDIHRRLPAICRQKASALQHCVRLETGASAVARKPQRRLSMSGSECTDGG